MTNVLYLYALLICLALVSMVIRSIGDWYGDGRDHGEKSSAIRGISNVLFWLSFSSANFYLIFSQQLGIIKIPLMILLIITMLIYVKFYYRQKKDTTVTRTPHE